jgi:hypothetical protein
MTFEKMNKKLGEVGLKFSKPIIERKNNKWNFELRIDSSDCKKYGYGLIHYRYKKENCEFTHIGHFIISGSNLNKLATTLFEMMKSKEVIYRHSNKQTILTWNEAEKRFIES